MRILATYSIKGGVGKTATAVNLAQVAAETGARVLVWDLDPQGAATFLFRVRPEVAGGGRAIIAEPGSLVHAIRQTDHDNIDLVPSDFSYRHLDRHLDDAKKPLGRLARALEAVSEDYDLVILDCAPSISSVSEAVFRTASVLLVPVIPTALSLRTFDQLDSFLGDNPGVGRELTVLGFFSMVDTRRRLHRRSMQDARVERPEFLDVTIPFANDVESMGIHRAPVGSFARGNRSARAYRDLWAEIIART